MRRLWTAGVVLSLAGALTGVAHANEAPNRISVAADGAQGDRESRNSSLSADGRYVAFDSDATNLVPGDTNDRTDVFVRDRQTGTTTRVSVATDGSQGVDTGPWPNPYSSYPTISADGRYVSFTSRASNFAPGDTNSSPDVFVHDRQTGTTTRVSVASDGTEGFGGGFFAAMSPTGRYVTFISDSPNLVPGDTNQLRDLFLHDRETGSTTRISVASDGTQANGTTDYTVSMISADGRFVAFRSWASNLVPGDTNRASDVFLRDTLLGVTTRISVASGGVEANELSYQPSMSTDGRYIAFGSGASNLVPGDNNGAADVFRHDRVTGTTIRISPASATYEGWVPDGSKGPAISGDGRFVAYWSDAVDIVPGDTNKTVDVFVHDVDTGVTSLVSRTPDGTPASTPSGFWTSISVAMSADGQYIGFNSGATNLVDGDTNVVGDVFVSGNPVSGRR
ncbi:TolB family protein [Lentzea sp. NPDC051213]|uniref:TolB family protein n=1 Tax=Lentzea sp. NPDC051213 TaxID=3364126 RepID=UPI0037A7542D